MPDQSQSSTFVEPRAGRPRIAPGYGILDAASGSGLLPWRHAVERLSAARNYWVVTAGAQGRPHAAPVWGLWLDDAFFFSTDPASRKGRNLAAQPEVVVHLESGDDVVIIEGRVEEVRDPATRRRFADEYDSKYRFRPDPDDPGTAIYAVRPRVASAWLESDFPGGATRWEFSGR